MTLRNSGLLSHHTIYRYTQWCKECSPIITLLLVFLFFQSKHLKDGNWWADTIRMGACVKNPNFEQRLSLLYPNTTIMID